MPFCVLMAVVPNRFGIHPSSKALEGRSIPKRRLFASFWDLPPPDSLPGHINPKTILNNAILAPLWTFPALFRRRPVFPMCHIRKKIGLSRTFSSWSITSGNAQPAFQAPLWHFPLFPIYHIRMKNGLPRGFSYWCVTSGRNLTASVSKKRVVEVEALCIREVWPDTNRSCEQGRTRWNTTEVVGKATSGMAAFCEMVWWSAAWKVYLLSCEGW